MVKSFALRIQDLGKYREMLGQASNHPGMMKLRVEHLSDIHTRIRVGAANNAHRSGTAEEHTDCRCYRQEAAAVERTWAQPLRRHQTSWGD